VSEAAHDPETPARSPVTSPARSPFRSPTYPARAHFDERPALEARLRSFEERIRAAEQRLSGPGNDPRRAEEGRTYHQLLGARDQAAEAARRLPLETGTLYEEDRERFDQADAAFERVWRQWEAGGGS
jgi:hypothetical protein